MNLPDPPCESCQGTCCKRSEHVIVLLAEDEKERFPEAVLEKAGAILDEDGWMLPTVNGQCIFLDNNNRCSIYARRPQACRDFTCVSGHPMFNDGRLSFFLEDHEEVVQLLDLHLAKLVNR